MRLLKKICFLSFLALSAPACTDMSHGLLGGKGYNNDVLKLPPLASAGPDQEVAPAAFVTLDGQGSYHPNGGSYKMRWTQILHGNERPVVLSSPAIATPSFLAPLEPAELEFQLEVSDGHVCTYDTVHIKVQEGGQNNIGPLVLAGGDRVAAPDSIPGLDDIQISASGSKFRRVMVTLCKMVPGQVDNLDNSQYSVWALTGSNNGLNSAPDFITYFNQDNTAFLSDVPQIQGISGPTTILPNHEVTLLAKVDEPLSSHHHVRWTQISGQPLERVDNGLSTTFTSPKEAQSLAFTATVSDGQRESAPLYYELLVIPSADNRAPVAIIAERLAGHVGKKVELDGTSSIDYDGQSLSFNWQQLIGPTVKLNNTAQKGLVDFIAPEDPVMLAFRMQVCDGQICAGARTTVVNILSLEENTAPHLLNNREIYLNADKLTEIDVTIMDDEQDAISDFDCQLQGALSDLSCWRRQSAKGDANAENDNSDGNSDNSDNGDALSDIFDGASDWADGASDGIYDGNSDGPLPPPAQHTFTMTIPLCIPQNWTPKDADANESSLACRACDVLGACADLKIPVIFND